MNKNLLIGLLLLFSVAAQANTWTPYFNPGSINKFGPSDNYYISSGITSLGVPGCAAARWVYFAVDTVEGITADRVKQMYLMAMAAKLTDKKIRIAGVCHGAGYVKARWIQVL